MHVTTGRPRRIGFTSGNIYVIIEPAGTFVVGQWAISRPESVALSRARVDILVGPRIETGGYVRRNPSPPVMIAFI
jgi:hypothetical protein